MAPGQSSRRRRSRRRGKPQGGGGRFPGGGDITTTLVHLIAEPGGENDVLTELLEIANVRTNYPIAKYATAYTVRRIGFEWYPGTRAEWCVLPGSAPASVNTRQELLKLPETRTLWNTTGTARTYWYRPSMQHFTGMQRIADNSDGIWTGLYSWYSGRNDRTTGSGGYLGRILFEVTFHGIMSTPPT